MKNINNKGIMNKSIGGKSFSAASSVTPMLFVFPRWVSMGDLAVF